MEYVRPRLERIADRRNHTIWALSMFAGSFNNKTGNFIKNRKHGLNQMLYGLCWGKGDTEIVRVANQWLVQPETHTIRVSPPRHCRECWEPEAWWLRDITKREPNTTRDKNANVMIFCYIHRFVPSLVVIREASSATVGKRCRDQILVKY